MARRTAILVTYFVLGAYAVCAQATLLREVQVLVFGSELAWGLVLAFWLAGVAVGAAASGRALQNRPEPWGALAIAGLVMPDVLLAEIVLLRVARPVLGVGPGEYIGPGAMILVTLIGTLPTSLWVGMAFPAASALVAKANGAAPEKARGIGWVYLTESAGALAGGTLFSFVLVDRLGAVTLVAGGGAVLAVAISLLARQYARRRWPIVAAVACAVVLTGLISEGAARRLDETLVRRRWESFAGGLQLIQSRDTRYQNLALGRLGDQFSLYANGIVAATWPNHPDLAIEAHLAACLAPAPKRILVLGGGAEGILKELLRYRPERLDYVTLDPALLGMIRARLAAPDGKALAELAGSTHFDDARRFIRRAAAEGREKYDLILLDTPEPASALEARLYTRECFEELSAILADDGVLAFRLSGAVGFWSPEAAHYVGSIVRPLRAVFPDVLLTFGYPTHVFAARRKGILVASGETLAARYRARGIVSPYFDPLWFEGASDLLDAEKRATVTRGLAANPPAFLNTDGQPAAALHHMRFWLATRAAGHAGENRPAEERPDVLGALLRLRFEWVMWGILGLTLLAACVGRVRGRRPFARTALLWSVGTTGFAGMAMELVLLYTFQVLYGYVYSMIGLVVGVFMFGLVVGSAAMNRMLRRGASSPAQRPGLRSLVVLDLAVGVFAAGLVLVLAALRLSAADRTVQGVTFALVATAGAMVGLVFPLAASIVLGERPSAGRAAGSVAAADYVGACLGALATGTLLVPILGVTGACLATAGMKALSAVFVGAAATMRSAPPSPSV